MKKNLESVMAERIIVNIYESGIAPQISNIVK